MSHLKTSGSSHLSIPVHFWLAGGPPSIPAAEQANRENMQTCARGLQKHDKAAGRMISIFLIRGRLPTLRLTCVRVFIYEARLLMPLMNTRRSPSRRRAPPGGRGAHPALNTSGVAVFLKPPSRCCACALALPLLALLQRAAERPACLALQLVRFVKVAPANYDPRDCPSRNSEESCRLRGVCYAHNSP